MRNLLQTLKESGQDHEFYPTSRRMLELVAKDLHLEFFEKPFSILDIGAGNGSALKSLCDITGNPGQKYAIEKSRLLVDSLPSDVFVIGTDFYQQTLIDKQVDVIFCNPPYSDFGTWMRRIVSEGNCKLIYMVVPQRWKNDGATVAMINRRCGIRDEAGKDWNEAVKREYYRQRGRIEVLGSDTFEDSEFRQARAQVDIIKIKLLPSGRQDGVCAVDPFDVWFEETFSINADKSPSSDYGGKQSRAQELHSLVKGQNVVERLEELYRVDFDKLLSTYKALEELGYELFKELGVNLDAVKTGLKLKIKGLKNLYWQELFNNLDAITDRLTSKSRKKLLDTLTGHTSVDFTSSNAYAVVVWAIKNANQYFDNQLLEVYLKLSDQENVRNYKSNHMVVDDNWRFTRKEATHYTLDYRLVLNHWRCFNPESYGAYDYPNGLHTEVHSTLDDLCTIAENLGFEVETKSLYLQWKPGELNEFRFVNGGLFMDVRAFKKGTIHIRVNQDFMRKLNVEAGRLNGWIKSPSEAKEETGIENAAELYGSNFKLKSIPLIASPVQPKQTTVEIEAPILGDGEQIALF